MNATEPFENLVLHATDGNADAQFHLGRHYAKQQEFTRARRWLDRAVAQNHALAQTELGLLLLYGIGVPHDIASAIALLKPAAVNGSAEANYQLALISLGDAELRFDAQQCLHWLEQAAHGNFAPAWRTLGLAWSNQTDDPRAAAMAEACFQKAIQLNDALSAFLLGWQCCQSTPNVPLGQQLLMRAAHGGIERARAFLVSQTASPFEPKAVTQVPISPPPDSLNRYSTGAKQERCASPYLATIENVLSPLECEYIIALGTPFLEHSDTVHPETGERLRNDYRNSSSMSFFQFQEDVWLRVVQRRLAALAGSAPLADAEYLALLRYLPGEQYKPHRDYLPLSLDAQQALNHPGQRTSTIFCYLSDVESGGATDFPILKQRIEPRRGRCVLFHNVKSKGVPDPDTLHAGLAVERGEKWLATLWIRERRYRLY